MPLRRGRWIVLACIGILAACAGGGGTAENTELNVIVPADPSGTGTPSLIDIQVVEYTIDCQGNSDVFLDNNASFPDEVTLNGSLEVVDGRPAPPGSTLANSEIWQGFMDLPPGPCTVQLRARDGDGEVICTATEPFSITASTTSKVDIVLICDISFQAPVGMLDVDGTFSFNVGNFCPDLFVLNCLDSFPPPTQFFPPPNPPVSATACEVRFRDGDSTCGQNCDPQDCQPDPTGLVCTPGSDPGVSTTITCTGGGRIECDGDPLTVETECTFAGDTLGVPGANPGPGTFFVVCSESFPSAGPVECTAVTTDGDLDCNKEKTVAVSCPIVEAPCFFNSPPNCDDGNPCTVDICDDSSGIGVCSNPPVPVGAFCVDNSICPGSFGQCDGAGTCTFPGCLSDADCAQDSNECTVVPPGSCDLVCGLCSPEVNAPAGTPCAAGTSVCDGAGACLDACLGVDCSDGNDCTQDLCDSASGGTCSNPPEPAGSVCDFGGGPGGGSCDGAGTCNELICTTPTPVTGTTITACRNSFNQAVSNFLVDMTVTPDGCFTAGSPFNVDITPTLIADPGFLNLAASTLCNLGITLTQADLNVVQVRVDALTGATCTSQLSELSPVPQTVVLDVTLTGVCGAGGTIVVNSGITVPLPTVTLPCTAGSAPGPVSFCAAGTLPFNVLATDPPVDTWFTLFVSPFAVNFGCGEAKVTASTPCTSDADCVPGSSCDLVAGTCTNIVVPLDPLTDCISFPVDP